MAIFGGFNQPQLTTTVQAKLSTLRNALGDVKELHDWLAGLSLSDLETLGYSPTDASSLQSAVADANALYQIYYTGQAPGTYPQVTGPYNFSASQIAVIGPLG